MARVLLVEDDELNRDMLSRRLRRRGFEVHIAEDGQIALERMKEGGFDLVLMDMSLPVMNGWDATRALKADPATRAVPVIALTAHAMAGDREAALEAGCDAYDTKPVDLARLVSTMQALLAPQDASEPG